MAASPEVIVRRQSVDVAVVGSERDGIAVQQQLSESAATWVAQAFDRVVDELDVGTDHVVIERLDVVVGPVAIGHWEKQLAEELHRQVSALVRRHSSSVAASIAATEGVSGGGSEGILRRSRAATATEAFTEFLRTGRLPWAFRVADGDDVESVIAAAWELPTSPVPAVAPPRRLEAVRTALGEPLAQERLVLQFSAGFVATILRWIDRSVADAAERAIAETLRGDRAGTPGRGRTSAGDDANAAAPTPVPDPTPRAWTQAIQRAALAVALSGGSASATSLIERARGLVESSVGDGRGSPLRRLDAARAGAVDATAVAETTEHGDPASPARAGRTAAAEPREDRLVDHAGLVLLHPFLARYFEGIGLVDEDRPRRLVDPARAVALLHHLATGEDHVAEHATTIAKVLCGVGAEVPIDAEPQLALSERAESDALLHAVIGHWDVLRNTSPNALRTEFLTRPGVLSVDSTGDWLLRVEERTVDILLGQLPWGISIVQTPWMTHLMRVDWRT